MFLDQVLDETTLIYATIGVAIQETKVWIWREGSIYMQGGKDEHRKEARFINDLTFW